MKKAGTSYKHLGHFGKRAEKKFQAQDDDST
jgi:hypothetical protein